MTKQCIHCSKTFKVLEADMVFLQRLALPEPTHCPDCRQQRRLAWRNEDSLYQRKCDKCKKTIISIYSDVVSFPVYCHDCWWQDDWSAVQFGRDINWQKPFFEQWYALMKQVPHIALHVVANEDADYVNMSGYNKHCYLLFAAEYNEDCLYGTQVIKSRSCVDVLNCTNSERCYEAVDVEGCYNVLFSRNCQHCTDCYFCYDCKGCTDCLFSNNLRNQRYVIFNQVYSPNEFARKKERLLAKLYNGNSAELITLFKQHYQKAIHRPLETTRSEQAVGDYLTGCNNIYYGFDLTKAENCRYVYTGYQIKDLMDVCHTIEAELSYEATATGYKSQRIFYSISALTSNDCYYSDFIFSSKNIFGGIGLRNAQYCILNKQYSKEDYFKLKEKLIEHMKKNKEWGEFFPMQYSPYAYNETVAQRYYPLTKEAVLAKGLRWKEELTKSAKDHTRYNVATSIDKINNDITKQILTCTVTEKQYRITNTELDFYRTLKLPIPLLCPEERARLRFAQRNKRQLWQRQCMCTQINHGHHGRCGNEFTTTYAPEQKELVYCEPCYQAIIY
ncbi:MAG: hypothetical protein WCW27_06165 [Patescibacteria group bacterium]|jgi:hypothetical protein